MRRRKPTAFSTDPFSLPEYGIAEPRLEPVVVAEHGEHAHHCHLVPRDAVARTGGVVEHQHAGNHADVVEDLGQPLAHAFRVLARHRGHVPHVRVRERGDQAVHLDVAPADRGDGLAEIDLHDAGAPVELEIAVAVGPMLLAPPLHVALHRRVRALEALLLDEPGDMRLAVWRCLRGMSPSAASHESTVPEYASVRERRPFLTAGFGEQSSMVAYFLTVSLDTPSRLAISRHDTPWASRILIHCCIDTGFVIPLLSRVALSAECVSTRENSRVMAGRCPSSRHFGETD